MASAAGLRAAVIGISTTELCGVRDHATLLAEELERRGVSGSWHWLQRRSDGAGAGRREVAAWAAELPAELVRERAQVAVVHYSVFAYAHRGLPLYVHPVMAALRRSGVPVVLVIHEAVYPWTIGGLRGKVWASTQRLALVEAMRTAQGVIATAEFRVRWLSSRRWLPSRPAIVAPVFSNLPEPTAGLAHEAGTIGLFGYAYEGADLAPVIGALELLHRRGLQVRLCLLGAPGADSPAGKEWRRAAEQAGVQELLSFSGPLAAQALSDRLAACELLLSIAGAGPTSRKGTLAASLASGTPVIALDGPLRWQQIVDAGGVRLVGREASALADALTELLGDQAAAGELGRRGKAFAAGPMGVGQTADAGLRLSLEVSPQPSTRAT